MPLTTIVMSLLDVLLRVPAVFLMDLSLSSSPSSSLSPVHFFNNSTSSSTFKVTDTNKTFDDVIIDWDPSKSTEIILRIIGVLLSVFMFVLPTEMLVTTYKWLACIGAVFGSYWSNTLFLVTPEDAKKDDNYDETLPLRNETVHILLQTLFGTVFCLARSDTRTGPLRFIVAFLFVLPSIFGNDTLFNQFVTQTSLVAFVAFLQISYIAFGVLSHSRMLYAITKSAFLRNRTIIRRHGITSLLETEWARLSVPRVLRLFWLARFCDHVIIQLNATWRKSSPSSSYSDNSGHLFGLQTAEDLVEVVRLPLVMGCDTIVAVLGMTSVVSSVAHHMGRAVQQFLMIQDDEDKSFGTVSAILFFVLALQTGLTGLEPDKRFVRLYRNFCLLFTAILHFVHNTVSPLLLSLSASRNRSVKHHGRALIVCTFLVLFPCWFLFYLWSTHPISTWLLAVSAFSIEVTVKVVISQLIYALFMIDAYRNVFWERLDDYVYYVRATGSTIEFLFGIFLFFNGAWILVFESGGTIRACMMCIHAYFNIWAQAKKGWKVFVKRRTAVNKINAFPEATSEQLHLLNDVCAICYQEMTTARITQCGHYFHALCLRKWLYVQDRCPMCHKALYKTEEDEDGERVANLDDGNRDAAFNGDDDDDDVEEIDGEWEQHHEHQD